MEKVLDAGKVAIVGTETAQDSGWTVIDAFDVMVHLFLAEAGNATAWSGSGGML